MSLFGTVADRFAGLFGYARAKPEEVVKWETRASLFTVNDLLYSGNVYATRHRGGALEDVLKEYVGTGYTDVNRYAIYPAFLPFRAIVDPYQNVLPGTWGKQVKPADAIDGKPVNPKLLEPLRDVWRASNLDTEKAKLIRWAANFGTVGMRVSVRTGGDGKRRVTVGVDHPVRLFNFEEDAEGNVTAVALKYKLPLNRGTLVDPDWETVEVVEEITKDGFSVKHDEAEQLEDGARANPLGFCPYVILRHKDNGTPFGDWAYRGSEGPVHRINWRISRQDRSIDRHQFPKWFGAGAGDKPQTVPMDDTSMSWVKLATDSPNPILQAIVPTVDQTAAREFWQDLRDLIRLLQPEMNLNDVRLLGGISGETLAQVLKPTAAAIEAVRPAYHHAFTRVLQMGVSAGVVAGAWDVGTGTGTKEAADRAYRDGFETFEFAPQPSLPETPTQRIQNATADVADQQAKMNLANSAKMVGTREQLRLAGYTDAQIDQIEAEKAEQDTLDEEDPADNSEDVPA